MGAQGAHQPERWFPTGAVKAYAIEAGMLNYTEHRRRKHGKCKQHMWYSSCLACADPDDPDADVDEDYVPEEAYWNDLKPPAYPAGVEELTALLVDAFTLGKYMHQAFFDTAFYMRTSLNESFFHLMALWVFKWAGWSNAGYLLGAQCCYLTHNEQCESKQLTTGRIEKTTRNPEGILRAQERRSVTMEWRLQAIERLFPNGEVAAWIARARQRLQTRRERRKRCASQSLPIGTVLGGEGGHLDWESVNSLTPCALHADTVKNSSGSSCSTSRAVATRRWRAPTPAPGRRS